MIYINIRARSLILAVLIIFFGAILIFSGGKAVSVFRVGEREIPIYSVERDDNKIALTFNCAWNDRDIDKIIEILKKHNVGATFFVVGDWAEKYPEALKKISDAGFEIGNHSYNHAHYKKLAEEEILIDMKKCDDMISDITAKNPYLFRAAYGEYDNRVVSICDKTGRVYIQWSVDSLDYKAKSAEEISNRVLGKVSKGDIILMHNGTEYTAEALDGLISKLKENYELVSVSELIYRDNFTIDSRGRQYKK